MNGLFEFLSEYFVLVVVGICLCVGYVIKHLVPTKKINKYIPLIMAVLGVGLSIWMNLGISPKILLEGLISGLASTGMYEAFKNTIDTIGKGEE